MIEAVTDVVCDTGPIIHLDELECLDLLSDFREILLSTSVIEEIEAHRPAALKKGLRFRVLHGQKPADDRLLAMCKIFALDIGETEALSLMESNPDANFLTDDASARMVAERMGFKVHGTIGIVVRSIRRRQKNPEEALSILRQIPSMSTLFIKSALLQEIILRIKREFNI